MTTYDNLAIIIIQYDSDLAYNMETVQENTREYNDIQTIALYTEKREHGEKKKKADLLWKEFSIVLRISFANLYFELIRGEKKKESEI